MTDHQPVDHTHPRYRQPGPFTPDPRGVPCSAAGCGRFLRWMGDIVSGAWVHVSVDAPAPAVVAR